MRAALEADRLLEKFLAFKEEHEQEPTYLDGGITALHFLVLQKEYNAQFLREVCYALYAALTDYRDGD